MNEAQVKRVAERIADEVMTIVTVWGGADPVAFDLVHSLLEEKFRTIISEVLDASK